MLRFIAAHGFDPGPTQRPLIAGAIAGAVAALPAGGTLVAFGTFHVVASRIFRLSPSVTAAILTSAFIFAGGAYGALLRRAANDRRDGWVFGAVYGFLLWMAAPVVVLPLLDGPVIAAGRAGLGFLAAFLVWGLALGLVFPGVHRPLKAGLDVEHPHRSLGPNAAARGRQWHERAKRRAVEVPALRR